MRPIRRLKKRTDKDIHDPRATTRARVAPN